MKWKIYDTCMGKSQLVCRASDLRMGDFFVTDTDSWLLADRFQVIEINVKANFYEIIGKAFTQGESQPFACNEVIFEGKTWVHYLEGENKPGLLDRGDKWIKEECEKYGVDYERL